MTSPLKSTSGPPELPGLIAASVWMSSRSGAALLLRERAVQPADDALRHRPVEPERVADGDDRLADAYLVGVAERGRRKRDVRREVGLDDRQVARRVGPDDGCAGARLVAERDLQLLARPGPHGSWSECCRSVSRMMPDPRPSLCCVPKRRPRRADARDPHDGRPHVIVEIGHRSSRCSTPVDGVDLACARASAMPSAARRVVRRAGDHRRCRDSAMQHHQRQGQEQHDRARIFLALF